MLWYNKALEAVETLGPRNQGQGYISLPGRSSSYRSAQCLTLIFPAVEVAHFLLPQCGMVFCCSLSWTLALSAGTVPSQESPGGVSEALVFLHGPQGASCRPASCLFIFWAGI